MAFSEADWKKFEGSVKDIISKLGKKQKELLEIHLKTISNAWVNRNLNGFKHAGSKLRPILSKWPKLQSECDRIVALKHFPGDKTSTKTTGKPNGSRGSSAVYMKPKTGSSSTDKPNLVNEDGHDISDAQKCLTEIYQRVNASLDGVKVGATADTKRQQDRKIDKVAESLSSTAMKENILEKFEELTHNTTRFGEDNEKLKEQIQQIEQESTQKLTEIERELDKMTRNVNESGHDISNAQKCLTEIYQSVSASSDRVSVGATVNSKKLDKETDKAIESLSSTAMKEDILEKFKELTDSTTRFGEDNEKLKKLIQQIEQESTQKLTEIERELDKMTRNMIEFDETLRNRDIQKGKQRFTDDKTLRTPNRQSTKDGEQTQDRRVDELMQILKEEVQKLQNGYIKAAKDFTSFHRLEKKLKEQDEEIINLKTRLSKMAGAKMTENNPSIADLSDPNRPTKIAERFSELYDNQWTDAFDSCTKKGKLSEEQAIELLYNITTESYRYCIELSEEHMLDILFSLSCPTRRHMKGQMTEKIELSIVQRKALQDIRKETSKQSVKFVQQAFMKEMSIKQKKHFKDCNSFIEACVELCWYMAIQSPKLYMETSDQRGKPFDNDKYRKFTKNGDKTDFVVWPVLFLSKEGGGILSKGVAQAK